MPVETGSDVSQRILGAARQLFFAKGFAKTPLRAIANEAGTSESGVLRIYQSKNGVLRAVYASCWAEINAHVDQAMVVAAEQDPDPRYLLIQLMRAILEGYQSDPVMNIFLLSHFGFRETTGLSPEEGVDPAIDSAVREEYHRYLKRIHDLCNEVARSRPLLAEAGVTSVALGHIFTSIIYGIQVGWYMAEEDRETTPPSVTIEEALAAVRFVLYPKTFAS
jgi:AcrR family transcriptional regulator